MDIFMDIGISTKVDAINQILEAIGSVGINSEEEIDWNIDAADADKMIDSMAQKIQANQGKGWWFNREEFHKLQPDAINGTVNVPNNTISCFVKRYQNKVLPVTMRGTQLFDTKELGYDMRPLVQGDGKLHCVLVVNLPFETLPATAKQAITDACRFWFVTSKEGDSTKMQAMKMAADASIVAMQAEDVSQKRRNLLTNPSGKTAYTISMMGGFNNV